jgi:hypothetical protein
MQYDDALKRPLRSAFTKHQTIVIPALFFLSAFISCSRAPGSAGPSPKQTYKNTPVKSASVESSGRPQDVAAICDRIRDIKVYPFHGDRGEDAAYDAFMDAGEAAVPCLIKKITDTTRIPDPRPTLKFPETTVGDIAYFLLIDITKLGFVEFMPHEVQDDFRDNGMWAYHAYVAKKEHRKDLQNNLYEWYRTKYGKDARAPSPAPG